MNKAPAVFLKLKPKQVNSDWLLPASHKIKVCDKVSKDAKLPTCEAAVT